VAELFYVPLLAQMREFPFGTTYADGGRGEAVFGEQLDRQLADSVAAADRGGLVDQIAEKLTRRSTPAAHEEGRLA